MKRTGQNDIAKRAGPTWNRTATDRRQWKALMEGYILQRMDKASVKFQLAISPSQRNNDNNNNNNNVDDDDDKNNNNDDDDDDDNNDHDDDDDDKIIIVFKGETRDCLQSPHCAANRLQHVRSSGAGAIVCKSRATHRALITCKVYQLWASRSQH